MLTSSIQTIRGKPVIQLPLDFTFFQIDAAYKLKVYKQMFDLIYNGQGGFTFGDLYTMPVSARTYFVTLLNEKIEKHNQEVQKSKNKRRK